MQRLIPKKNARKKAPLGVIIPSCPACGCRKSKFTRLTGRRRCNDCYHVFEGYKSLIKQPTRLEIVASELKEGETIHIAKGKIWIEDYNNKILRRY